VRGLLVGFTIANCVLAILSFAGKIAQRIDPGLYVDPIATLIAWSVIGFLLTWVCAALLAVVYGLVTADLKHKGERSMYCRTCGYVLLGLRENRCPECGRPFDPDDVRSFRRYPKEPDKRVLVFVYCWLGAGAAAIAWLLAGLLAFLFPR
jgi:ribosomal protein L37E